MGHVATTALKIKKCPKKAPGHRPGRQPTNDAGPSMFDFLKQPGSGHLRALRNKIVAICNNPPA